MHTHCFWKSSR